MGQSANVSGHDARYNEVSYEVTQEVTQEVPQEVPHEFPQEVPHEFPRGNATLLGNPGVNLMG
jgi:hypothetical protein